MKFYRNKELMYFAFKYKFCNLFPSFMRKFVAVSENLIAIQCLNFTNHQDREFLKNIVFGL